MAAGVHDLRIEQGASFYNEVQWLVESKDNPNEFVPVDITAWEIRCQIRARANSPIIIKTVNLQKIDAINGIFAIYLNPVETTNIPTVGAYWKEYELFAYDIEAESGTGVERLLNGKVFVSPNVTRDASASSGGNIPGGIDTPGAARKHRAAMMMTIPAVKHRAAMIIRVEIRAVIPTLTRAHFSAKRLQRVRLPRGLIRINTPFRPI